MTEAAKEARRLYQREYLKKHPEQIEKNKAYRREWGKKPENKEKIKKYVENYWERKAQELANK